MRGLDLRVTDTTAEPAHLVARLWESLAPLPHLRDLRLDVDRNPEGAILLDAAASHAARGLRRLCLGLVQTGLRTGSLVCNLPHLLQRHSIPEDLHLDLKHNALQLPLPLALWQLPTPLLRRVWVDVSGNPRASQPELGCPPRWLHLVESPGAKQAPILSSTLLNDDE